MTLRTSAHELGDMTVAAARDSDKANEIAHVTGVSAAAVRRRIDSVHGKHLLRNVFAWPDHEGNFDAHVLGRFTAKQALHEVYIPAIAKCGGVTSAEARRRLREVHGNKWVRSIFWPSEDDDGDGRDDLAALVGEDGAGPNGGRRTLDMPPRLPIKVILGQMAKEDLADFLRRQDIPTSGTKDVLVDKLVAHHDRNLGELMEEGVWTLSVWNDFARENFGCAPRKRYEDLADDLLATASPEGQRKVEFCELYGEHSVAEVRDDEGLLDRVAGELELPPHTLTRVLKGLHGGKLLSTVVDDLFEVAGRARSRRRQSSADAGATADSNEEAPTGRTSGPPGTGAFPETAPPPELPVGTILAGRFRVLRRLGRGGFGGAYEVECSQPRGVFVAKVPNSKDMLPSIRNELAKLQLLSHPGLCRVFACERDAVFGEFLLLEHGGRSLQDAHPTGVSPDRMVRIIIGAADALDFLHNHIAHGDVNPGNILVDAAGRVRLTDFGTSGFLTAAPASAGVTRIGTRLRGYHPQFSAIEVHQGRPPSPRSDQYSLALVAQWLLCGKLGFPDLVEKALEAIPAEARATVHRALHAAPSQRFATCTEFARALEKACE